MCSSWLVLWSVKKSERVLPRNSFIHPFIYSSPYLFLCLFLPLFHYSSHDLIHPSFLAFFIPSSLLFHSFLYFTVQSFLQVIPSVIAFTHPSYARYAVTFTLIIFYERVCSYYWISSLKMGRSIRFYDRFWFIFDSCACPIKYRVKIAF